MWFWPGLYKRNNKVTMFFFEIDKYLDRILWFITMMFCIYYLEFICKEDLSISPTYLFIVLLYTVQTHVCFFVCLFYNPMLSLFSFFLILSHILKSFKVHSYFLFIYPFLLLFGTTIWSRFILSFPCPSHEITNSSKSPSLFFEEWDLVTKMWALYMHIASGVPPCQGPLRRQN